MDARALAAFDTLTAPACLLLSSGSALQEVLAQLPDNLAGRFTSLPVVAASERLADAARDAGVARVVLSDEPRPGQLVKAACTFRLGCIR